MSIKQGHISTKRTSTHDDYMEVLRNLPKYISETEVMNKFDYSVERLKKIAGRFRRIGYQWSGGKDSIVALAVARASGIRMVGGLCMHYPTEYESTLEWYSRNTPDDCITVKMKHPSCKDFIDSGYRLLFPNESKWANWYFKYHWGIPYKWRNENHLDAVVTGRRTKDNNFCGSARTDYLTEKDGVVTINCIADWTHEEVLGFIRYNHIELPPCYFFPNSFQLGKHTFNERPWLGDEEHTDFRLNLEEVWSYNDGRKILIKLASELPLVEEFIDGKF